MNRKQGVPFVDLMALHRELEEELVSAFRTALRKAEFVGGAMVEEFEQQFAGFCGTRYCVGVSSGTDALRFALIAAGIGCNDLVITVPNTFIATVEAISQAGARPRFVDIDERTFNMDPGKLQEYLENRCRVDDRTGYWHDRATRERVAAIIPVHLYGQMADMDPILQMAERYGLRVIEDACQAHGAEYFSQKDRCWHRAGSMACAGAFSFYPGKNLGACGEAGAVTTNDESIARIVRMLRDHGQSEKYRHDREGYNGRLDAIQAGILSIKLPHLSAWNRQRRANAQHYQELFSGAREIALPVEPSWARAVYHLYVVRVQNRSKLREQLAAVNIGTGIHYPVALHLQNACRGLGYREGDFPVAEKVTAEILSLPMYHQLIFAEQEYVAKNIVECLKGHTQSSDLQHCGMEVRVA